MPNFLAKPKGQNDNRGRSRELWINCPIQEIRDDFSAGIYMDDDFLAFNEVTSTADEGTWEFTDNTAVGSAATAELATDVYGGELILSSVSTTDTEGGQIQYGTSAFKPDASTDIWFETLLKIDRTDTDFFAGLAIHDTSVLAAGAITATDHIGFLSVTGDGVLLQVGEKAGTADLTGTTGYTWTADGYMKLGFKVTGGRTDGQAQKVEFWVNGVQTAKAQNLATANIPVVGLKPTICCHSGSATASIMNIDWVSCYQENRAAVTLPATA